MYGTSWFATEVECSGAGWLVFLCLFLNFALVSVSTCLDWPIIKLRQWEADLIGLFRRQSRAPTTVSSQRNAKLKNIPLIMTKYSSVSIVTPAPVHHRKTQQGWLHNVSVSCTHSLVQLFWQLVLLSSEVSRPCTQICSQADLNLQVGTEKFHRFFLSVGPFHSWKVVSKKILQCVVWLGFRFCFHWLFCFQVFRKGFLTFRLQPIHFWLQRLSSIYPL